MLIDVRGHVVVMKGTHSFELFGRAMRDHHRGENPTIVLERDDGLREEKTMEAYFQGYDEFPVHHKDVLEYARGRVLDLGCGAGRHALYLQDRGFEVAGIDMSPLVVEVARERGLKDCRVAPIQDLPFEDGSFDTVLMLGNNFGLAGGRDETAALLHRLHTLTSAKGRLLVESVVPGGKEVHMAYLRRNITRGRPPGLLSLRVEYQGEVGDWFDLLILPPQDMAALALESGWNLKVGFYSDNREAWHSAVLDKEDASESSEGPHWDQRSLGEGW